MGARKSKHSRSVITERSRFGLSRPVNVRSTLPVVVVVCDDAKTACAYFTQIKREVRSKVTVEVVEAPNHGATPDDVVRCAISQWAKLKNESSHDPDDSAEVVWVLIDLEVEADRVRAAYTARDKAKGKDIRVALSNPCFEVWTLAHLIDTGEAFNGCGAVVARIKAEWRRQFAAAFENKAQADYSKLRDYRDVAIQRAKARSASKDQSWTEVHRVVEAILALAGDGVES
jgi:hypothetical protein